MDKNTKLEDLYFMKFIRDGKRIVYDTTIKDHSQIANEHGIERTVDDGGFIEPVGKFGEEKRRIRFVMFTQTCYIRGDHAMARSETAKIASEILGEEKVCLP